MVLFYDQLIALIIDCGRRSRSLKRIHFLSSDRLPKSAEDIAQLLLRLNDSADVLNSSTLHSPNPLKGALSPANTADRKRFLHEMLAWLGTWSVQVPSVRGLQHTIAGILVIWERFGGSTLPFLMTRRLNQDCLENMFGVIRMSSGQNDAPNPTQFRMALRKCATNSLLFPPPTANCEPDGDALVCAIAALGRPVAHASPAVAGRSPQPTPPPLTEPLDTVDANVITYVGGYLARRGAEKHECEKCGDALTKKERFVVYEREMLCGLKSFTGLCDSDVGSLNKPTQAFYEVVELTYRVTQAMATKMLCQTGIMAGIEPHIMSAREVKVLRESLCPDNSLLFMVRVFVRLLLHKLCKRISADAWGKGGKCRKLLKLNHGNQ